MSRPSHLKPDYSEFAEVDPSGRYVRYNEVLGRGATKTVYRAFDELQGIEVAWNQVKPYDYLQSPDDLERLYSEVHLLHTLNHKNIMKFHASWVDASKDTINLITEIFNSSLRQYRLKHRRVSVRTVKHWCRQILSGLVHLHSHDPQLIHRYLKCDNILINGNDGTVKIGDLGLAAILRGESHVADCIGTLEFMAPEVYEEKYNELVDIYSFGMCILEMVTSEYPYSECADNAEIYKKVVSGEKPDALHKLKDEDIKEFVEKCSAPVSLRLSAVELLKDPFLQIGDSHSDLRLLVHSRDLIGREPQFDLLDDSNSYVNGHSNGDIHEAQNEQEHRRIEIKSSGSGNFEMSIKGDRRDGGAIFLSLLVADKKGLIRKIYFPFDIKFDTALNVATEMVDEVDSIDHDVTIIADMIDAAISFLVPEWRPGKAKYSKRQFGQLGNKSYETYDDAKPKPSQWNATARRNPQDSVTNNPLGCRPSVLSGLARGRASEQAPSYLGNKPTICHGVPLEALHPVSARDLSPSKPPPRRHLHREL